MSQKKILLVDDELTNVKMLETMLRLAGYSSEFYVDSTKAWQALVAAPEQYHLVLADRIMPHMNALQLLAHMKQNVATQHIPLVVITGLAETEDKIDLFQAGVYDILLKPIDRDVLLGLVKRVLKTPLPNR